MSTPIDPDIGNLEAMAEKAQLADTLTECVKDQGIPCTCYACLLTAKDASEALVSYVLTASVINQPTWIEGLCERINAWAEAVGDPDRVTTYGLGLQIIKPMDVAETRPD